MAGSIKRVARAEGAVWQVYGQREGKKIYVGSRPTEQEARDLLEEHRVLQRQIERGEMPRHVDHRRTLGEAVELWMRQYKRRSKEIYRHRLDRYILPRIAKVPLVQVNATMIEELQDALLSCGLDPATVNAALRPLSSAFTYFVKVKRWVRENPCAFVAELELKPRSYNWIKSREEQEKLLAACKEPHRTMLAVLLMTGMRLAEMTHLHWSDVDLSLRLITVQRGKGGTTKSGRLRQVPINNALLPVLKAWRLRAGAEELVFPGRGGKHGMVRHPSSVREPFKTALRRTGLDATLRVHDCRHTYASHYLREGGNIFRLSRYLGHSSVKITERVYAHMVPADFEQDWDRNCLRVGEAAGRVMLAAVGDNRETSVEPDSVRAEFA